MYAEAEKFPGFAQGNNAPDRLQVLATAVAMRLGRWLLHLFVSFNKLRKFCRMLSYQRCGNSFFCMVSIWSERQ